MFQGILYEIKRLWPALAVICVAMLVFGDTAQLAVQLYSLSMSALVLIVAHLTRKALFPYANMEEMVKRAGRSPVGASIVFASVVALIAVVLLASTARAGVAERAKQHLPVLSMAFDDHWPTAPMRQIVAGQIEQESSWKDRATLKTSRELGRGLAQLTIAYRSDGRERFNAYVDAVSRFPSMRSWNWKEDPYNVRYQLTYVVLRDRSEWMAMRKLMVDDAESWRSALVCYNAGRGRVLNRRALARAMDMPVDRWSGGLEHAHGEGENRILYGRALWQMVNDYPEKVFSRAEKYAGAL